MTIKTLIFDLGGVIIDLNFQRFIDNFACINPNKEFTTIMQPAHREQFLMDFETGNIDTVTFRQQAKLFLEAENTPDHLIDNAWNSLIVDFDPEMLAGITTLKQKYQLILFSNINPLHYQTVLTLSQQQQVNLNSLFNKSYYSCLCGFRKPTTESFIRIMQENNLQPSDTLFIDDSIDNIVGAQTAGLQTFHYIKGSCFNNLQNIL